MQYTREEHLVEQVRAEWIKRKDLHYQLNYAPEALKCALRELQPSQHTFAFCLQSQLVFLQRRSDVTTLLQNLADLDPDVVARAHESDIVGATACLELFEHTASDRCHSALLAYECVMDPFWPEIPPDLHLYCWEPHPGLAKEEEPANYPAFLRRYEDLSEPPVKQWDTHTILLCTLSATLARRLAEAKKAGPCVVLHAKEVPGLIVPVLHNYWIVWLPPGLRVQRQGWMRTAVGLFRTYSVRPGPDVRDFKLSSSWVRPSENFRHSLTLTRAHTA